MTDAAHSGSTSDQHGIDGETRRDFLYLLAGGTGAVFTGWALWPFIDSLNPAADTLALASVDVDLSPIEEGQAITAMWRGKPVFVRHRTPDQITAAEDVSLDALPDPQADADRVQEPKWLIVVGVCTHLGCIPKGQKVGEEVGEYGGWFCPCHGSHYDTSGRIRKGPAPANLPVPDYIFLDETTVQIG